MNNLVSRCGALLAPLYAALSYLASLALLFAAAVLTGTRAREAFIFVFLPGVSLAVFSRFIWTASRSAMILALAVAVALAATLAGTSPEEWAPVIALPVVFAIFTGAAFVVATPAPAAARPTRVADEIYATVVYLAALLAVFLAPFNYSRSFGLAGTALYALLVGPALGALSALIWRGRIWAMIAGFAFALAHWFVLANLDPNLWRSVPNIAAAAVAAALTLMCVALARRRR
jgi:hypothetical protein